MSCGVTLQNLMILCIKNVSYLYENVYFISKMENHFPENCINDFQNYMKPT